MWEIHKSRFDEVRSGSESKDDGRLARLVREGTVRPGRAALPRSFFTGQLPRVKSTASVVAALLEERRESR
jgi:hypothetical protein